MTFMLRLAFALDKDAARKYLRWARCCAPPGLGTFEELSRKLHDFSDQPRYVIHDLLDFFDGSSAYRVIAAICFVKYADRLTHVRSTDRVQLLRHVCDKSLPMDISSLCSLIEDICATFVVSNRMQWKRSLHDVALPRSWLRSQTFDRTFDEELPIRILFTKLLPAVAILLERLYSTTGVGKCDYQALEKGMLTDFDLYRSSVVLRYWVGARGKAAYAECLYTSDVRVSFVHTSSRVTDILFHWKDVAQFVFVSILISFHLVFSG